MIQRERLTATFDGEFVVFRIGMRINTFWKIHRWCPVVQAMPRTARRVGNPPCAIHEGLR